MSCGLSLEPFALFGATRRRLAATAGNQVEPFQSNAPVAPEGVQRKVVLAVLGPDEEDDVDRRKRVDREAEVDALGPERRAQEGAQRGQAAEQVDAPAVASLPCRSCITASLGYDLVPHLPLTQTCHVVTEICGWLQRGFRRPSVLPR